MKLNVWPLLFIPVFFSLVGCSQLHSNTNQWRCTATDSSQQHWIQYAPTKVEAATQVRNQCESGVYRSTCFVRCIPPTTRWHCVAVDKGGHVWYYNSTKRVVAIRNAREDCKKNTTLGGCRVPVQNCSMS